MRCSFGRRDAQTVSQEVPVPDAVAADIQLARRVAAGDPNAQRLFVLRLMRRVQRLCRALLHNRDNAKDASQASLLAILRSAGTYRGESSLERWADRITIRSTLRQSRQRARSAFGPAGSSPALFVNATADPAIAARQYLEPLPEAQRTVLILRCGFEYSVDEIAELTQTSPNTVKDRLKRARVTVRRALGRESSAYVPAAHRSK